MNERFLSDIFPAQGGWIGITVTEGHAISIKLGNNRKKIRAEINKSFPSTRFYKLPGCREQIQSYLKGKRKKISLKFRLENVSPLQKKILLILKTLPYGKTISYSGLALKLRNKRLARAVGHAMANNPLPLIFPCHRVIRSDGTAGGFMGKTKDSTGWKSRLLNLEKSLP